MRVIVGGEDRARNLVVGGDNATVIMADQAPPTTVASLSAAAGGGGGVGGTVAIVNGGDEEGRTESGIHHHQHRHHHHQSHVVNLYPLSCYYFGSRDPIRSKNETLSERILRLKSNYETRGLRTCVEAVILVELLKHPHLLLLQVRNSIFKLPGGRLRPGESDVDGLRRKLSSKLSAEGDSTATEWEVGECIGRWWRADFETLFYPYLPPSIKKPKECIKLFLVKLRANQKFIVPKNMKLIAVPLSQIHENHKSYGSIIAGIPQLLSKFTFNIVEI
ncbi:Pre-mRNA cleavage factor Im 25 kDa subunit 1 [Dionaea muscipula]